MAVRFDRLNSREILGESHPREITMMLHLAQIQQQSLSAQPELRLLAAQEADNKAWTVLTGEVMLPPDRAQQFHPDQLVLADLSEQNEVLNIQDAKEWVLEIVQRYLATGVTIADLAKPRTRSARPGNGSPPGTDSGIRGKSQTRAADFRGATRTPE
jgi:hypothetical protein